MHKLLLTTAAALIACILTACGPDNDDVRDIIVKQRLGAALDQDEYATMIAYTKKATKAENNLAKKQIDAAAQHDCNKVLNLRSDFDKDYPFVGAVRRLIPGKSRLNDKNVRSLQELENMAEDNQELYKDWATAINNLDCNPK